MFNLEIAFALLSVFPPDGCALGKSSTSFLAGIERSSFESALGAASDCSGRSALWICRHYRRDVVTSFFTRSAR